MSKKLQEYLSKIKKQNHHDHRFPKMDSFAFSVNHKKLSKMFSGCKHPHKTLSFSMDSNYTLPRHHRNKEIPSADKAEPERGEATLSDIERFLVENFKSLYGNNYENDDEGTTFDDIDTELDKNNLCHKSCNFFKGGPPKDLGGSSVPTTEDGASCSSDSTSACYVNKSSQPLMCLGEKDPTAPDECIVIFRRSYTPYDDFWSSMKEMIEARGENGASADGEFLQEMLLCYLNLNEKKYYRYIVSAFMNVTADLRYISDN